MHAEVIAVGTELTTGAKLDTNSQWLSLELADLGIPVQYHTSVADSLDAMVEILRAAVNRSDVVLVTGGLGPTLDDLTRQALAELTGTELVLHEPSLEFIRGMFARHKRDMPERNRMQAMFPAGSEPISNPRGTAPGIWMQIPRDGNPTPCLLAAMPGVPSEMRRMFTKEVAPRLPAGKIVIRRACINCFGVGESKAEELLGDLTARGRDPEIGITVHEATITLRIAAHGLTSEECGRKIATARNAICERMGTLVFGEQDDELEHVVVRMLCERSLTFSSAESGSSGILAHRISSVEGATKCYFGGLVVGDDAEPTRSSRWDVPSQLHLNTEPAIATESAARAIALANDCRTRFGTDFAVAIGNIPPYDPEKPPEETPGGHVALVGEDLVRTAGFTLLGDPAVNKVRAVKMALNLLRLHLLKE